METSDQDPPTLSRGKQPAVAIPEDNSESYAKSTSRLSNRGPLNYQSTETTSSTRERRRALENHQVQPHPFPDMMPGGAGHDSADEQQESREEDKEEHRLCKFLARFKSVELENKGATARDHLALERTFLAWLRTSLAFASIGIAITQLFRLNTSIADKEGTSESMKTLRMLGKPLGSTFLGISIMILFLGYHRYFQGQEWVMKGKFPAARGTIILVTFMAFSIMITSLVVVIVVGPGFKET